MNRLAPIFLRKIIFSLCFKARSKNCPTKLLLGNGLTDEKCIKTLKSADSMKNELEIAIIGLDTSHAPAFTRMLNDPGDPCCLPGGRVVKAWPGGSPDFELSWSRVDQFTEEVRQQGATICNTIEEAVEGCDAVLLESADGRVHLEQFKKLVPFGKPVFIDKPLACSLAEAEEIARLSAKHDIPAMSSSSLRFLQGLPETVAKHRDRITGVELHGPLSFQKTQPGYFWYGMHAMEMLFAILGPDFQSLEVHCSEQADQIETRWPGGITGRMELIRGEAPFGGTLVCGSQRISLPSSDTVTEPFYQSLLKEVLHFFRNPQSGIPLSETLKLTAFVEKANALRLKRI